MSRFGLRTFVNGQVNTLMKKVESSLPPTTGDFRVRFYDIDGTILKEEFVNQGNDATAPVNPNIDPTYLVFAEWNQSFTNVQRDIDVGAIYDTIDGKTYIFVRITDTTGLTPALDLNKSTTDLLTVDWGDSTTITSSVSGNVTLTKAAAYASIGDYVISIDCAGGYRNPFPTQLLTTQPYRDSVQKIYMGATMTVFNNCFNSLRSMRIISLEKSLNADSGDLFNTCRSLIHINLSKNTTSFGFGYFSNCSKLRSLSLLNGITSMSNSSFNDTLSLTHDIIFPTGITTINNSLFNNSKIKSISFVGSSLTTISQNAFIGCFGLTTLEFPSTVTSIGAAAFNGCIGISEFVFNSTTPPTLANVNAFSLNDACKIYVPDGDVATYKAATNWVTYANYIYPLSTRP
jgi:hypothetical protein